MESSGGAGRPYAALVGVLTVAGAAGLFAARAVDLGGQARFAAENTLVGLTVAGAGSLILSTLVRRDRAVVPWLLLALVALVTAGTQTLLLSGDDDSRFPLVAAGRAAMVLLALTALLLFPGVARSAREWLLLLLDGWLTAGALVTVVWTLIVTQRDLVALLTERHGAIGWFLTDLVMVCVVLGLVRRIRGRHSAIAVGLLLTTMITTFADLSWAVFGVGPDSPGRATYVGAWTTAAILAIVVPWLGREEPFAVQDGTPRRLASVRLPHVLASIAIACVVVASANGRVTDVVDAGLVLFLLAGMLVSLLLLARENKILYRGMVEQAERFRDQAARDALTGLPNRREFTRLVGRALESVGRERVSVLFLDLDGFKHVNDTFGHETGDALLVQVADRLSAELRGRDVVARFGGDEFVALLVDCTSEQAGLIAERLRIAIGRPYRVADRELVVSASLGLARPAPGEDAQAVLRNADLALYRAKEQGRDQVVLYRRDLHATSVRRVGAVAWLRQAITEDRLRVQFEPIVDLDTGVVRGLEARLRLDPAELPGWHPEELVRAADDSGLRVPLRRWLLSAAIGQAGAWRAEGYDAHVAVDLTAGQLEQDDLARSVREELLRHGLPPDRLTLQITERELVGDRRAGSRQDPGRPAGPGPRTRIAALAELRAHGVRVVLDDFGVGDSSLSRLSRLPLDGLTLAAELVAGTGGARDVVPAVLRLGRDLDLAVVAAGVDTADTLARLRAAGGRLGQGALFGGPLGAEAAGALLRVGRLVLPVDPAPEAVVVSDVETQVVGA